MPVVFWLLEALFGYQRLNFVGNNCARQTNSKEERLQGVSEAKFQLCHIRSLISICYPVVAVPVKEPHIVVSHILSYCGIKIL